MLDISIFFLGAKICHAIMLCNIDEATLFFVIYDFLFHAFEMLKLTLNNLTICDSILNSGFIAVNYCTF